METNRGAVYSISWEVANGYHAGVVLLVCGKFCRCSSRVVSLRGKLWGVYDTPWSQMTGNLQKNHIPPHRFERDGTITVFGQRHFLLVDVPEQRNVCIIYFAWFMTSNELSLG